MTCRNLQSSCSHLTPGVFIISTRSPRMLPRFSRKTLEKPRIRPKLSAPTVPNGLSGINPRSHEHCTSSIHAWYRTPQIQWEHSPQTHRHERVNTTWTMVKNFVSCFKRNKMVVLCTHNSPCFDLTPRLCQLILCVQHPLYLPLPFFSSGKQYFVVRLEQTVERLSCKGKINE